jgi:hypothetical protein
MTAKATGLVGEPEESEGPRAKESRAKAEPLGPLAGSRVLE